MVHFSKELLNHSEFHDLYGCGKRDLGTTWCQAPYCYKYSAVEAVSKIIDKHMAKNITPEIMKFSICLEVIMYCDYMNSLVA